MCDICRKNPCDNRCPNAETTRNPLLCTECGSIIDEDTTIYRDRYQNLFCSCDCVFDHYDILETEDL